MERVRLVIVLSGIKMALDEIYRDTLDKPNERTTTGETVESLALAYTRSAKVTEAEIAKVSKMTMSEIIKVIDTRS